jgi:hypothetical protein
LTELLVAGLGGEVRGGEAFAEFWVFDPMAKVFEDFGGGFLAVAVEAGLFELNAGGFVVASAELGKVAAKAAHRAEAALEFVRVFDGCDEIGGVAGGDEGRELI